MPRRKKVKPAAAGGISALLAEKRLFQPPPAFRAQANCRDPKIPARAARDPEKFWAEWAARLEWSKPWKKVLEWKPPHAKWFLPARYEDPAYRELMANWGRSGQI